MVKMAIKQFRGFQWSSAVPAAGVSSDDFAAIMRDVIPDKPYKLHYIQLELTSMADPGDVLRIGFGKNVSGELPPYVAENLMAKVGLIFQAELNKEAAAALAESRVYFFNPQEPVSFDKDDKLNIRVDAGNSNVAIKSAYVIFTIGYTV